MKKQANLKICVLGGRNFGKTSLLSSLILISGDKDSGITVSGGNEQKLNIYNEYKNNNGKLIATNWDDICKFRYNLTGNGKQKYKLTFIDYPGEFFQKFFSDSGAFSARFLSMFGLQKKSSVTENANRTFTKNEAKLARQLVAELTSADAFIVLLPADITKDIYKVNLQIFKTQLQVLLEKIHNINPYIPVCLAINKWDMFGKPDSELADVLKSKPYQDFDNMLTRDCGDYYFCQAISAFGKNRSAEATTEAEQEEFKEEWDRKSEPVNVMQMLLKISEAAEKSRYLHLREKYKNATILSKILHFPAVFARHYRKGANAEENRNFCSKGFVRCISALAGTVISIVVLCFVIAGTLTTLGEFAYLKIQGSNIAEIEKSFEASKTDNTSAEKILKLKENLAGHPLKLALFCTSQVEDLSARISKIEHQYNSRIWQNAIAYCDDNRHKDENPQKLKSEERKERCRNRTKHLKAEQEKLTDLSTRNSDGRTVKDCFAQKIEQENRLFDKIDKDSSLDDALYDLKMTKAEEKCRYIESLIDQYESTYSHRKKDFDELRLQLNNLEQQYHDKLIADLKEIKDFESKDFDRRISLAQQRIARIEQERQHLSNRSNWHNDNDQMISAEKQNIENWKHDNKFYVAFDAAMKPGDDQIQRLVKFLNDYDKIPYSRCAADWDVAEKKKNELIVAVNSNLQKILNTNSISEPQITAVEKVKRLQNCINAYEQAKKENPTEIEKYNAEIATLKRNLAVAEKDTEFEAEYNKILASADKGKLKSINSSFFPAGKFVQVNYPHKAAEYKKLEEEKARLLNKWNKEQDEARKKYADDAKQSRAIRLECAEKLLTEYNRLLEEYLPASTEYNSLSRCIRELNGQIAEHKKYNVLLNEFNKIKTLTDSFHIVNEIATFDIDFKAGDYPAQDGVTIFAELNSLRKQHNGIVKGNFDEAEKKFTKPADNEFARLAEYYQKLRQNVDTFMQKISEYIPFYKDLQNLKNLYGNNIKKYQRFAKIAAELYPLISNDGQKSVKDARSRLSAIKAFYANEDFSKELASAPELVDFSTSLKKIQNGVENFIAKELSAQLENISKKLPIGASPEDQINNWKEQLNVIDDYCFTMIQSDENSLYRNFSTKRKDLQTRLGKKELRTRFDRDRSKLDAQLESELDVTGKITLINNFVGNYDKHEDFKGEITGYISKRNDYDQIRKFDLLEQKCNTLINDKSSNVAGFNDLTEYRDKINKNLDSLKNLENSSIIQQRAGELRKRLNEELDFVKKAIGDGSWNDIEKKAKTYKNNPTESNYNSLKRALDSFNKTEYSSYEDEVKEIERKLRKDWNCRHGIISAWKNLQAHKSVEYWREFAEACKNSVFWTSNCPQGLTPKQSYDFSDTGNLRQYLDYYNFLCMGTDISAELVGVYNLRALGEDGGAAVDMRLFYNSKKILDMNFSNSYNYRWTKGDRKKIRSGSLVNNCYINAYTTLIFEVEQYGQWLWRKTRDRDTISFDGLKILIPLLTDEGNIIEAATGNKGVRLDFKFSRVR